MCPVLALLRSLTLSITHAAAAHCVCLLCDTDSLMLRQVNVLAFRGTATIMDFLVDFEMWFRVKVEFTCTY